VKSFIIYNVDGIIIRTGSCVDSDFDIQAGDGEFVMEGIADDLCHMILDGQIVDKPEIIVSDYEIKAEVAALLRSKRNSLLSKSDWTQFPDSPLSDIKKTKWATYRQALRDIPENYPEAISIDDIIWPTKPE
jgi:hypothetical protein